MIDLRKGSCIETTVYHNFLHVYLHWDSFSPNSWKIGTLKKLLLRAFVVCSNEQYNMLKSSLLFKKNLNFTAR